MDDLIVSYLILNGECMLPGIGKLFVFKSDAVCDVASKKILPSESKFDLKETGFSDSGQLISYISQVTECTLDEASGKLSSWIERVNKQLNHQSEFELPMIGKLKKSEDGKISLTSFDALKVFKPVRAERVIHESDTHEVVVGDKISNSAEMNLYLSQEEVQAPQKIWPAALIIFLVAAALITYYFLTGGNGQFLNPLNAPDTYISK